MGTFFQQQKKGSEVPIFGDTFFLFLKTCSGIIGKYLIIDLLSFMCESILLYIIQQLQEESTMINDTPIDTLVIVGNGFDLWQGLPTSYRHFYQFYLNNREKILKKLHIKKGVCIYEDGETEEYSAEEVVYGDPFFPGELDYDFWGSIESSLEDIDAERLIISYEKDRVGLRALRQTIRNAKRIIREAFCSWISSIQIERQVPEYRFGKNCLFINFNYTSTLEKRFGIDERDVFHIHGEATDKESIVFGHSGHPQTPEPILYTFGGRFRGLYFVDELLYETDKQADEKFAVSMYVPGISRRDVRGDQVHLCFGAFHEQAGYGILRLFEKSDFS